MASKDKNKQDNKHKNVKEIHDTRGEAKNKCDFILGVPVGKLSNPESMSAVATAFVIVSFIAVFALGFYLGTNYQEGRLDGLMSQSGETSYADQ